MAKRETSKIMAKILKATSDKVLSTATNSRCMLIYHQPKQPEDLKKYRKF